MKTRLSTSSCCLGLFNWYKSSHSAKTKIISLRTMILRHKSWKKCPKNISISKILGCFRVYVASSEIWFCRNITREKCVRLTTKKVLYHQKKAILRSIKFYMCHIQCGYCGSVWGVLLASFSPPKSDTSAFPPAVTTSETAKWQLNTLACSLKLSTFSNFFRTVALPTP